MSQLKKPRILFIDNLKLLIITLVILIHAAVTYSGIGSWYYKEHHELTLMTLILFFIFQTFSQAFSMGLMFLLAGYFASAAFDRKGFKRFIKNRIIRLGTPTLIYMLTIQPFMYYLIDWHHIRTQTSFWEFYPDYLLSPRFFGGTGPLWFTLALLIFSIIYAFIRAKNDASGIQSFERSFSSRVVVKLILWITTGTFVVRFFHPLDTAIFNMQLCYFTQYVILFSFGTVVHKNKWLSQIGYRFGNNCLIIAFIPGIVFLLAIILGGGALTGSAYAFKGGMHWQSLAFAFWESFTGVCMSVGLIVWFRENFNWQNKLLKNLSDSAFAVYVFHAPILVLMAQIMQMSVLPPILKFLVLSTIALPVCFLVAQVIKVVPLFRTVTNS